MLSFNFIPCIEMDILGGGERWWREVVGRGGGGEEVQDRFFCKNFKTWFLKLLDCSDKENALQVFETNLLICADHKVLIALNEVY